MFDLQKSGKFRFDFFTIWPNGFNHTDDILQILRDEKDIEIIFIQRKKFTNMRDFVFKLYGCDSVPISHLESKLHYLYKSTPEVINIFVKNYNPQEVFVGTPPFRKIQCEYIVKIKNKIRNQYNPRHLDPTFHIPPLNAGVSHEHVIHASDYEEQVDYYLKMLGIKKGISYLENDDDGLAFRKPYHLKRPDRYSFRRIPISSLLANILVDVDGQTTSKLMPIEETPHYKFLRNENKSYQNYLRKYQYTYLLDDHSEKRFMELCSLSTEEIEQISPVIVKPFGEKYIILDGVHRAAIYLYKESKKISSVIFEYES